jgi:hypothetical protein
MTFEPSSKYRSAARLLRSLLWPNLSRTIFVDARGVPRERIRVSVRGATVEITTVGECLRQLQAHYQMPFNVDLRASRVRVQDGVLRLDLIGGKTSQAGMLPVRSCGPRLLPDRLHIVQQLKEKGGRWLKSRSVLHGLGNLSH